VQASWHQVVVPPGEPRRRACSQSCVHRLAARTSPAVPANLPSHLTQSYRHKAVGTFIPERCRIRYEAISLTPSFSLLQRQCCKVQFPFAVVVKPNTNPDDRNLVGPYDKESNNHCIPQQVGGIS
jgi:hypothetical protein